MKDYAAQNFLGNQKPVPRLTCPLLRQMLPAVTAADFKAMLAHVESCLQCRRLRRSAK